MKIGLIIVVISIIWYVIHAAIYNHYLQKNNPGLFDEAERQRNSRQKRNDVQVVVTSGQTPAWVMILGLPPIPLFVLGVLITVIGFIINLFN
jgi:hypothetical protein